MDLKKQPLIEVCVSRDILVPAITIYDAWLDSASPCSPWHGALRAIVNPRVDGLFYHAVDWQGKVWNHYGRFLRLERPRLIEHTWMSEATQGIESVVRIALAQLGGGTLVTITHQRLPDDAMGRSHESGWAGFLEVVESAMCGQAR